MGQTAGHQTVIVDESVIVKVPKGDIFAVNARRSGNLFAAVFHYRGGRPSYVIVGEYWYDNTTDLPSWWNYGRVIQARPVRFWPPEGR